MEDTGSLIGGSYTKRIMISGSGRSGVYGHRLTVQRMAARLGYGQMVHLPGLASGLAAHISVELTEEDVRAAEIVAEARPDSLRLFDQISMLAGDLAQQAKIVRPMLAGKRVAFMGDNDGASLVLGLMGASGAEAPSHMLILDFDRRILAQARALAQRYGFSDRLETRAYNAFDPLPEDLIGQFDVFYTNPPYGSANAGKSGQLFIARGMALCHSRSGACGCVILPDDAERSWTRTAMRSTQSFILAHGWQIAEKVNALHGYHLPTDPGLMSGMLWVSDVEGGQGVPAIPYTGRRVSQEEIEHFYGTKVSAPYPRYVTENGEYDYDWQEDSSFDNSNS